MFDFVEESFDEVTFAVEREVAQALGDAVCFRWNDNFGAAGFDEVDDGFAVHRVKPGGRLGPCRPARFPWRFP